MKTISVNAFKNIYREKEKLTIIDVRSPLEFKSEWLAGALNIPLDILSCEGVTSQLEAQKAIDNTVYLLCKGGKRAQMAAEKLAKLDQDIVCIEGGMDALRADSGLPISQDKGAGISLERQVRIAAGGLVLTGLILGSLIHPTAYLLSGFVGAGLMFAGITDWCGMGLLLAKMPWNKV